MRYIHLNQSANVKDAGLIASSSREELPFITQGDNFLVDARLVHQKLNIGRQFTHWIEERIKEFGFKPNEDFYSNLAKSTGGRPAIEIHLTLDMAKELCMVERSEQGRAMRRYFIEAEKKLKGILSNAVAEGKPTQTLEEDAGKPANGVLFIVPIGKSSTHSVYLNDVCYTKFAPLMKYLGYESESGSAWHVKLREGITKLDNVWFINERGFELLLQKITRMPDIDRVRSIRRDCFGRKPSGEVRYGFGMEEMMTVIKELNRSPIRKAVLTNMLIGEKGGRHE